MDVDPELRIAMKMDPWVTSPQPCSGGWRPLVCVCHWRPPPTRRRGDGQDLRCHDGEVPRKGTNTDRETSDALQVTS
jgi:hypothetical protein